MTDCIFCKIAKGDIPVEPVYEDDQIIAFNDMSPQAPVHVLIIPKEHISTLNDLEEGHTEVAGKLLLTASKIAKQKGFSEPGYRTIINCNEQAGQTVFHIHCHLLAGRAMAWPPG